LASPRNPASKPIPASSSQTVEQDTLSLSTTGLEALSGQAAPTAQAGFLTYPNYSIQRNRPSLPAQIQPQETSPQAGAAATQDQA
jgi:hypothetical protein